MGTNYLLILVIVAIVALTIRGYKRGFLQMAVYFCGMLFILFMAKRLSPVVCDYLKNNTDVVTEIQTKINDKLSDKNSARDNSIGVNQEMTINSYELPTDLKNNLILNNTEEMYQKLLVSVFEEYVSKYLSEIAVKALSFVIVFLILALAFKMVLFVTKLVSKIPIIKGINKMAGALIGFSESIVIVWIFFFISIAFLGNDISTKVIEMISDSQFLTILYNSNFLLPFIR